MSQWKNIPGYQKYKQGADLDIGMEFSPCDPSP